MKRTCFHPFIATASVVFAFFLLFVLASEGAAQIFVPGDYARIQDAITAAQQEGDWVFVEPGTYQETLTLKEGVEVFGLETARTFLDGGGSGTIVTAGGLTYGSIRNFTFINALVGIEVSDSAIDISNNVFEVGTANNGTAIVILSSPSTIISNNTFYGNNTAISRDVDLAIINNIFANNNTTIETVGSSVTSTNIQYNAFDTITVPTGTWSVSGDPKFVDPANVDLAMRDFHLQEGSSCRDKGDPNPDYNDIVDDTRNDIGAYGGQYADPTPFPVTSLEIVSQTNTSIELAWSLNKCYLGVGAYYVYYGYATGVYEGTDADSGQSPSPILIEPDSNSYTLMDLDPLAQVPVAPILDPPVVGDTTLTLTWTPVPGAAGYYVHYGTSSPGEFTLDAAIATSLTLTGLTNGQDYRLAVTAYAPAEYFIVVTAWDYNYEYESAYSSEVKTQLGPMLESALSNIQTEKPDTIVYYPGLQNSGGHCFIATAAYGSPIAPEVRVLRAFRDQYLLASGPGRLFVTWYYRYGPAAAGVLNSYPAFKPAVRAALMPVVGAALILTNTPPIFTTSTALMIGSAAAFGLLRKRFSKRRMSR